MYAVVTSGGKQYRVEAGSELVVERLTADAGATITFDRVLLVGDGEDVTVGTPTVQGASVSGTVLGEVLGPKLIVFKFKQKATYRRKSGHRQHLTRVRIDEITAAGTGRRRAAKPAKAGADDAAAETTEKKQAPRRRSTAKAGADDAAAETTEKKPARRRSTAKARAKKAEE
jgi:large subunit ribosomal protein L21